MASVGCSLMEAYNVPSFQTPKRRKGCVMDTTEIKASSEPFEAYTDTSREMAMWKQSARKSNTGPTREGFENESKSNNDLSIMPKQYSGYVQDKNYYCKTYNICPETFRGSQMQDYEEIPSQPNGVNPNAKPAKKGTCQGPLQPPRYDYPMTPESRSQYDKALQLSMNQESGSTQHYPSEPMKGTDKDVSGYTDEDLDQFLKTNEMKNEGSIQLPKIPNDNQSNSVAGRDPYASSFAESMTQFMKDGVPKLTPEGVDTSLPSAKSQPAIDPWDRIWDMALFVVAGLLIILLLEQLFKLAMLYGMKRAFLAIEPLLVSQKMASD
jgi:hypothetical protein